MATGFVNNGSYMVDRTNGSDMPRAEGVVLTSTATTAVFTASTSKNARARVEEVIVCNTTSSTATITLAWASVVSGATSTFTIQDSMSVANKTTVREPIGWLFAEGDAIKATASASNVFHVITVITDRGRSF